MDLSTSIKNYLHDISRAMQPRKEVYWFYLLSRFSLFKHMQIILVLFNYRLVYFLASSDDSMPYYCIIPLFCTNVYFTVFVVYFTIINMFYKIDEKYDSYLAAVGVNCHILLSSEIIYVFYYYDWEIVEKCFYVFIIHFALAMISIMDFVYCGFSYALAKMERKDSKVPAHPFFELSEDEEIVSFDHSGGGHKQKEH